MSEEEENIGFPEPTEEEQSVWEAIEELKRSNLVLKKALGRQGLENKALHEAIEAIAKAQQEGQERLAEYFEDLEGEEESEISTKGTKMSKRREEIETEDEDEGMSTTTKMFLSGLAGFAAGSAVTAMYFKYGAGAAGAASPTQGLTSMQGLTVDSPRNVTQMR